MITKRPKPAKSQEAKEPKSKKPAADKEVHEFINGNGTAAAKQKQPLMPVIIRFRPEILASLDSVATSRGTNRTALVLNIIADYLEKAKETAR